MKSFIQIFVIAVALAADAVSVSVATGMTARKRLRSEALRLAFFFGFFQAVMPIIGWGIGAALSGAISGISKWVAFVLLGAIGIKMIVESRHSQGSSREGNLGYKRLIILSIATSIDALIVGTSIRLVHLSLPIAVTVIGLVTFVLCYAAYFSGRYLGKLFGRHVELVGGIVLIGIGCTFLFR